MNVYLTGACGFIMSGQVLLKEAEYLCGAGWQRPGVRSIRDITYTGGLEQRVKRSIRTCPDGEVSP